MKLTIKFSEYRKQKLERQNTRNTENTTISSEVIPNN